MNILRIVTLNKHGDFEEVLFSSILSYLLSPNFDHGLGTRLLKKVVSYVYPDISDDELLEAVVMSEYTFGNAGNVDVFIEIGNRVVAIEVKIWDRSARNVSQEGIQQLERYCCYLRENYEDKNWRLIFLIPDILSSTCMEEFSKVDQPDKFRGNVKLATWNPSEEIANVNNYIEKSIYEMILELYQDVNRVDMPLHTQWLLDSLYDILPEIIDSTLGESRFPAKRDLQKLDTWKIFNRFFTVNKRWPSPLHTTVGIPYGYRDQRAGLHSNSLYRIRTVKDYYKESDDMEQNLLHDIVELELWDDVYKEGQEDIANWVKRLNLKNPKIVKDAHIDQTKKEIAWIITISKDDTIEETDIEELNSILRNSFRKLISST